MRRLASRISCLSILWATATGYAGEFPEEMVPQPQPSVSQGSASTWNAGWEGVNGRTYLMQWTQDMVNWNYFPLTEAGAGSKAYGFASSTDKLMLRLECGDETPDLAKTGPWQPPLLTVGGEWTVYTRDRNGDPASGVDLSFYLWPAAAMTPQTTALSKARTLADGACVFNPSSIPPGDRIEVRMTGSPNQRVYLPWSPGRETPDTAINPGGNGVSITGTVHGRGTGQVPVPGNPPNDQDVQNMPVYRLEDFLLMDFQMGDYGHREFPSGFHLVTEETTDSASTTSEVIETPPDSSNWENPYLLGFATDYGSEVDGIPYEAEFTSAFGDPAIEVKARRTIFIDIQNGVWPMVPYSNPVYPPADVTFEDGVVHEWGAEQFPYDPAECPFEVGEGGVDFSAIPGISYERYLVLGPVPARVPLSVMAGGPFYYRQLEGTPASPPEQEEIDPVSLFAELPLGCDFTSHFRDGPEGPYRSKNSKIVWNAVLAGPSGLKLRINTDSDESDLPIMWVDFDDEGAPEDPTQGDFTVTITAFVKVPNQETPPSEPNGEYTYAYATYQLGSFTTEFIYSNSDKQAGELRGTAQGAPESAGFNGGQRMATLEPERRIGVTGRPAPDSPTFVDALTGRFHHSEADFALPVPGSDLSLAVTRRSSETIWTDAFGLHPSEQAVSAFGPGWTGNLAASVERLAPLSPDGSECIADPFNRRTLLSRLNVRDCRGDSHTFLEYRDGTGTISILPVPTALPEPSNSGITLEYGPEDVLTLRQPALGLVHVFQKSAVDFKIANNRDMPITNGRSPTGFTRYGYYRLTSVTDRFGVRLNYQHGSNPANLVPETISVEGRPNLQIRIKQVDGRVVEFWDPSGTKHSYHYETQNLAGDGRTASPQLVLESHQVGDLTTASYGYDFHVEADPRPVSMLLAKTGGGTYQVPTLHFALNEISNGKGESMVVGYRQADVRWAWSDQAEDYYPVAGDPLLVDSITLPGQRVVDFDLQHVLKNAAPGLAANLSIVTEVTTLWEDLWRYEFSAPQEFTWTIAQEDAWHLPSASALIFHTLTRSCQNVVNSDVTYTYDAAAGFALNGTQDAGGRDTAATHDEAFPLLNSFYQPPVVSAGKTLNSWYRLPSTTTDRLERTTTFDYVENPDNPDHMRVSSVTDHRNRVVTPERGVHARTEAIRVEKAGIVLSRIEYGYDMNLPGAVNKITRKALAGAGDPGWVVDLVTDIDLNANGFPEKIGNDSAGLHTGYSRSPSGRLLEVTAPNGGIRSYQYDASGLLESTFLEDGSTNSYGRDLAGRIVFSRDAMGNASGIELDGLGRVTRSVRDMNRNLDFAPEGTLSGVDAGTDIVSSISYLDGSREIRSTDPRGFISISHFDGLGRTTKAIAPGNEREPGIMPDETNDRVTIIDYDPLVAPDHPVKITDPLGYETHYKFDSFARLEMVLREYGEDESSAPLHAGTGYGYDPDTGLLERITAIRTPLDAEGDPVSEEPLETLVTRILRDDLDRPQTSIFAEGTDKELRRRTFHTTTGIPFRREIRDALADGGTPENWSAWEMICDSLGRPEKLTGPPVIDARNGQPGVPFTSYDYAPDGTLFQTGDSYDNLTTYGHDARGLLSWIKQPAVFDAKSGLTLEPVTLWRRDANGLVTRVVDPLGYAWNHERDAAGRVKTSTGPVVHPAASADRRRPVWHRDFDPTGNLAAITDPEGRIRTFAHYPDGLTKSTTLLVTFIDEFGTSSVQNVVEQYGRDELGRITRVTDGADQATTFTYDGLHRTLTTTRDPDDSRAKTETTTYDALLALSLEDAAGIIREFQYDDQFRLSRIDFASSPGESLDFGHDLLGRINSIEPVIAPTPGTGNPAVAFHYNALGLLDEEISNGVTTTYGHDLNGRPARTTNSATSRVVTTQHDEAGRVSRVVETDSVTLETLFGHDLAGNLVREDMPNGCFQETAFDPIGRITERHLRQNSGDSLCEAHYRYDLLGNVTRIEESATHPDIVSRVVESTYNERNQLVTETTTRSGGALGTAVHTRDVLHRYDLAENRLSSAIATAIDGNPESTLLRAFDYGDATDGYNSNQLHTLTETPGNGPSTTTAYSYSANGNRETRTIGTDTDYYTYDSFDRLAGYALNTASPSENGEWTYRYDPVSRRISRSAVGQPASTRHFAFSGSSAAHEWEGSDMTSHTGGGVGGRLHTRHPSGSYSHPFHNNRGDVMAEFSAAGNLISHTSRDADGLTLDTYGTATGPYGPNGKWQEPGGLANDGFRHRDLHTATFLTRDPAGFIDGPNTYNYVGHNPWSAFDPHGLASTIPVTTGEIGYVGEPSGGAIDYSFGWDTGFGTPGSTTFNGTLDDTGTSWGPAAGILSPLDQAVMTENTRVFAAGGGIESFDYRYQDAFERLLWAYSFRIPYVPEEVRRLNELAERLTAEADEIERDTGLDIAGTIDPSGAVDLGNSIRLWNQGRWLDSVLTAAGVVPVVGDFLGKGVKSGRQGYKALMSSSELFADTAKEAMGARHIASDAHYLNDLLKTGQIPANARGTYFTLDEGYDALTPFRMQVPHDGAIRVEFGLNQLGDDIAVPLGNYGKGPHLEPSARDFPDFGFGGASQRITTSPIQADRIIDTRTGEILFQRR